MVFVFFKKKMGFERFGVLAQIAFFFYVCRNLLNLSNWFQNPKIHVCYSFDYFVKKPNEATFTLEVKRNDTKISENDSGVSVQLSALEK